MFYLKRHNKKGELGRSNEPRNTQTQTHTQVHAHEKQRVVSLPYISFPPIQKIMNVQRIINENNNNNSNSSSSLLGGGENHVSNKNKSNSSRARGVLGNITNNNNSRSNNSNNFATTAGKKKTTNKNFDSNSIQCLQRDVERLARQECHEFEAIGRNSTTNSNNNNNNNNEDRIILSKIMEELIVEYSERELPHSYYYKTLREASNRAGNERDDLCRFSF